MVETATVRLWGTAIGAVTWLPERRVGAFQYHPDFLPSGIEPAPLTMPLREAPCEFPSLGWNAFRGLPGLLADSLPDKFGNAIIDEWLAAEGRSRESFHPVERLCYVGTRGMGALEFEPATQGPSTRGSELDIARLVDLSSRILAEREGGGGVFRGNQADKQAIEDILRVGTSAGGARAKVILAWNPTTGAFRSGQAEAGEGFEPWLVKFDGVSNNRDRELADPAGYGRIEFAYHEMAVEAGIEMAPCRLHLEGGRAHFMTRRFDRSDAGDKLHMQSLGAIGHLDYDQPGSHSYEQALDAMKRLGLPRLDLEQQVLRTFFNVVARNQDDHVKNIAFLMGRDGSWRLSPAFDIAFNWNDQGVWTHQHQMSVNGRRRDFSRNDLLALAAAAGVKAARARTMIERVCAAVSAWPDFARSAEVGKRRISEIAARHRLHLAPR